MNHTQLDPSPVADSSAPGPFATAVACGRLFALTIRRQLLSRQTLVAVGLAALCLLIALAWSRQREPTARKFAQQILMPTYVAFLMPILAICYGASSVGGEREDRTLIYLLIAPIPRPLVYAVKAAATVLLVTAGAAGTLLVLCGLEGAIGRSVLSIFLPACLLGGAAYATLFLMLGAVFRHGTVISLAYWFFLEVMFGNMPGIIKRVSVAFYVKCMIYDAGSSLDLGPVRQVAREMFLPVSGTSARIALLCGTIVLFALGVIVFSRREYRDVS